MRPGEAPDSVVNAPGSDEAIALGCRCPVMDNAHGQGFRVLADGIQYVISGLCPLHASKARGE